jgi:cytochrome c-type biogenesis protein CcmH/NrfG
MTLYLQLPFAIGTLATPGRPVSLGLAGALLVATLAALVVAGAGSAWFGTGSAPPAGAMTTPVAAVATPRKPALESARNRAFDLLAHASEKAELSRAEAQVSDLVDSLAERLRTRPDDVDGWQTLGRAYAALGQHAQAIGAYRAAVRLRPDDPTLLAEYAFSAAVTDPRGTSDEAMRLVEHALRIDPRHAKALALAGTLAVDRKDYRGAIAHWEHWGQVEPADTPLGRQVRTSIQQARQLAGLPGAAQAPSALSALPVATATRVASTGS